MKKREFVTLVKNLREDVVGNMENRRKELSDRIWELKKDYEEEVSKALLEMIRNGKLLKDIGPDKVHVIMTKVRADGNTMIVPHEFWIGNFQIPEGMFPMPDDLKEAQMEYDRLTKSYFKAKRLIDAWKLKAIEHKTYNQEPFPEELCPYVSEEFRELINCGGEKE